MIVGIKTHFDAAHYLPKHEGKCKNLHGHRWVVEIEVEGVVDVDSGMVLDFALLKEVAELLVEYPYDHKLLNEVLTWVPTAENLAMEIFRGLLKAFTARKSLSIHKVRVYETPDNWAEVRND
jgi:6-pyruvoyltetrahydropterin/6-carboxytetrahydropterin synthase